MSTADPRAPAAPPPDTPTTVRLSHFFFRKIEDIVFHIDDRTGEPCIYVKYAKQEASIPFAGFLTEFRIAPDSEDGRMLDMVQRGLRYVKALRIGDPVPLEILTREASWSISPRHFKISYQRVSMQLVNWVTGSDTLITDPEQLIQLADDPGIKKKVNDAFGSAARDLGLPPDRKDEVVGHVQELANELAYIEALRERLRHIDKMREKIQALRRSYARENTVLLMVDQVARLIERATHEFKDIFNEIDAQTGEIIAVLKNLSNQIAYIRDRRDELHVRLGAWDDMLKKWANAPVEASMRNTELVRDTYRFLAPRFMATREWVLMTKLKAMSPDQAKNMKVMRW
jgi:hypothetical protein